MQTSFSDWAPVLIASEASLELLNSKLDTALPMERFRPNVIVSECVPHAEVCVWRCAIEFAVCARKYCACNYMVRVGAVKVLDLLKGN